VFGFINFGDAPENVVRKVLIVLPIFLISITLHEFAHAAVARALGDPTPEQAGRVTINPIAHLDALGTLMILFGPIGWAKPVPIDPGRLGRWGTLATAAAGPLANLLLAVAAVLFIKHLPGLADPAGAPGPLLVPFFVALSLNLGLAVFNLLPIPPLDGSQIIYSLLPARLVPFYHHLMPYGIVALVALVMLPIGGVFLDAVMRAAHETLVALVP
jgi:Zn-dependent protease